jgi:DNA-binding transcriptional LysR family regulator
LAGFIAVAETGSFTAAAKKLGRDASIISRRVSQLEQQLGVRLLSRTTRRVGLTEVGALYLRRIQSILDELAEASREASDIASSPQGLLRISLPATFGRQWIAPLLPRFLSRHPQIRIDARFTDRQVDVVSEGFDVAIRVGVLRDSSLAARKLASYRNLLVAAPSYLAAHGKPRIPDDLKKHSSVGFTGLSSWPDWPLMRGNQRKTVRPIGPLVADNSEAVLIAAIGGAGITLAADWLAGPALREGKLVEVLPGWSGKGDGGVYAILPPGRLVPAKTRSFVDDIGKSIKAGWAKPT